MFWNENLKIQTRVYPDIVRKYYLEITDWNLCLIKVTK